jgi:Rps23 Pro-64 3,4-dihydroxylase Tpa1-like proline 4-hydroxylase
MINVLENFVSDQECDDLLNHYNKKIWDAKDPFLKTGFGISEDGVADLYKEESLISDIVKRIGAHLTSYYKEDMELKTLFHSVMTPGAVNPLHWDNYIENGQEDVSTLFYLNDDYEGGELSFPDQDIFIKPKKGSFIFFRGEESLMHEVKMVKSGNRTAFVGFFWPTRVRIASTKS